MREAIGSQRSGYNATLSRADRFGSGAVPQRHRDSRLLPNVGPGGDIRANGRRARLLQDRLQWSEAELLSHGHGAQHGGDAEERIGSSNAAGGIHAVHARDGTNAVRDRRGTVSFLPQPTPVSSANLTPIGLHFSRSGPGRASPWCKARSED